MALSGTRYEATMSRRPRLIVLLSMLTACSQPHQSCDPGGWTVDPLPEDPRSSVVATVNSGPGKITFVNSAPAPGATISGCGANVEGCVERLKIVFNLRPDVDLRSQRLRVRLVSAAEAQLECSSTDFDLAATESFAIEVACPSSPAGLPTPFTSATMVVEIGRGDARIEQAWTANFTFSQ
jgi:hypothetical protein